MSKTELPQLLTYKKGFASMRLVVFSLVGLCLFTVLFTVIYVTNKVQNLSLMYATELSSNQWAIEPTTGSAIQITRESVTEEDKIIEVKHHIKMVYNHFFEFDPYEDIDKKLNDGLYLVAKNVGEELITLHDKKDVTNKVRLHNMFVYAKVDSIPKSTLIIEGNKIQGIAYGRQRIKKQRGEGERYLDFQFEIEQLDSRTPKNPHGMTITKWTLLNNKPIEIVNKQ